LAEPSETSSPVNWHTLSVEEVIQRAESTDGGLTADEARRRLQTHGPNRLPAAYRKPGWLRLLEQFHNVLIYILLAAGVMTGVLAFYTGDIGYWIDTVVIILVVVINAAIGFVQEGRAEKALDAISGMLSLEATVIRDGRRQRVAAEEVVPGDIIEIGSGDKVPADVRLLEARELRIDESMLTGESVPTEKQVDAVEQSASLGDRTSLAFSGSLVTTGRGRGVVYATGANTQIGQINEMVTGAPTITTPLIAQMTRFGKVLSLVIVGVAVLTFAIGWATGYGAWTELFRAAVALAVAAIPEGLPAIMTIVLAIGVRRMAQRHAIIRRLPAVDTLGALTTICSDKTGTLTRNEMTVTRVVTPAGSLEVTGVGYEPKGDIRRRDTPVSPDEDTTLAALLRAGTLCNDSDVVERDGQWVPQGDPMEGALLTLARKAGVDVEAVRASAKPIDTIPFESANRYMATLHDAPDGGGRVLYVKGAPEGVVGMCVAEHDHDDFDADKWRAAADELAGQGMRVLALARKQVDASHEAVREADVQQGLTLLGLVGIIDPPRDEAIDAVGECRDAGIRVVMITGDHAKTASAIAAELGIGHGDRPRSMTGAELDALDEASFRRIAKEVDVFARVSPEHKLRLVEAIQSHGQVVAMTGDGVNDAPALKRANVGIAMGIKGTEVSKESAEMVLTDDNFASIAHAVEEGRTVYDNLRKAILFILPTNGGQSLTILAAIVLGLALPLTPVQVLWINMVTAVTLALAMAFEPPEQGVMHRPPRDPKAGLLDAYFLVRIAIVSLIMAIGTFAIFFWAIGVEAVPAELREDFARTMAVNTMVLFGVFYIFNTRYITAPVLNARGLFGSRSVWIAIGLVVAFQLVFTYVPFMQIAFATVPMDPWHWLIVLAVASTVLFLIELEKLLYRTRHPDRRV
jgi:magnesium-transporting ATPase (P-type)